MWLIAIHKQNSSIPLASTALFSQVVLITGIFQSFLLYTIMWPAEPKLPSVGGFVLA